MNQLSLPTLELICLVAILVPAISLYWFRQPRHQQERRRRKFHRIGRSFKQPVTVSPAELRANLSTVKAEQLTHCVPFSPKCSVAPLLNGRHEQLAFELFDYGYTAADETEVRQTILVCRTPQAAPVFLVRPQELGVLFKPPPLYRLIHLPVLAAYGYTLSMGYEIDDTAVEMLKRLPANTWPLLRERGALLACNGEQVVYYYHGRLLTAEPAAVEGFISEGLALAAVMMPPS